MNLLEKIVTPAFVTFQAHCFFAYFVVFTFGAHTWPYMLGAATIKEFYIDKHFEINQTFHDNLKDWVGYVTGIGLALLLLRYFRG